MSTDTAASATSPLASVTAETITPSWRLDTRCTSKARERNPARWSGSTRDWSPIGPVTLNPERDSVVSAHSKAELGQPLAA